jgi:hypothetical protein
MTHAGGQHVVTTVLDDRVEVVRRRVEQWADELIDLGARNTLLHYKVVWSLVVELVM